MKFGQYTDTVESIKKKKKKTSRINKYFVNFVIIKCGRKNAYRYAQRTRFWGHNIFLGRGTLYYADLQRPALLRRFQEGIVGRDSDRFRPHEPFTSLTVRPSPDRFYQ